VYLNFLFKLKEFFQAQIVTMFVKHSALLRSRFQFWLCRPFILLIRFSFF